MAHAGGFGHNSGARRVIDLPNMGWRPRWYQQNFWDAWQKEGIDRLLGIWHRRAGKDDVCLHGTCIKAMEDVGNYWHMLPQYKQGRKAIWTAVNKRTGKKRIDEAFPIELRKRTNDQEMFIEFINGSTWQVLGSDNYDSHVGSGCAGVVFSEWALSNPSAWAYIRPMLVENGGWAAFITTPRGKNHAFRMLQRAQQSDNWFGEVLTIEDTEALTEAQIQEALEESIDLYGPGVGEAVHQQEYYCSFTAAIVGAFYAVEMLKVRNEQRITEEVVADPTRPVHRAWDIGVGDDTSIWWFQVIGGQVNLLDCYTANGQGIDHYRQVCDERAEKHGWIDGVDYVPHDAQQRQWVLGGAKTVLQQMIAYRFNPELAPNVSKMDGIAATRKTLKLSVFHPRCEEAGIEALEQYRREWDDEKKTFKTTEYRDWTTHLADAFRYLALSWRAAPRDVVKADPDFTDQPGIPMGLPGEATDNSRMKV